MQTWTISGVKERAKAAFKANYWKIMLVTLLVTMVTGGGSIGSSVGNIGSSDTDSSGYEQEYTGGDISSSYIENQIPNLFKNMDSETATAVGIFTFIATIVVLVIVIGSIIYSYFLANPFLVGACRFFNRSLVEDANVRELVSAFSGGNYLRTVKTMFLMNLFTGLWSMLFVIPGIIKSYEYRMIPYIIMENPELSTKEVFARSKQLMDGNKWSAFLLDLSFIGWWFLAIFTCGILAILWVSPYQNLANAALYRELSGADRYEYQNSGYQTNQNMNDQYNQNGYYSQQTPNSQYDQNYFSQQDAGSSYTQMGSAGQETSENSDSSTSDNSNDTI